MKSSTRSIPASAAGESGSTAITWSAHSSSSDSYGAPGPSGASYRTVIPSRPAPPHVFDGMTWKDNRKMGGR